MHDHDGFTAFYERRRAEVHAAVAVTVGDYHLAADAVDEAFARAAERWGVVSRMQRPAGWVYRVAVNWATSWRRKWSRRPTLPTSALDGEHHDDLDSVTLTDGLAELPLIKRRMLVLRFVMAYSVPETARVGLRRPTLENDTAAEPCQPRARVHRAHTATVSPGWRAAG